MIEYSREYYYKNGKKTRTYKINMPFEFLEDFKPLIEKYEYEKTGNKYIITGRKNEK
jgi:hypothetical protein